MHLVITGLMASGKTTIGRLAADRLGWDWRDSDVDIESLTGHTGREIAERDGVDALHDMEEAVLLDALAGESPTVVSAAAWVVESERCRTQLARTATVVVLHVPVATLLHRLGNGSHRRRVDEQAFRSLAERRAPMFASVADHTLDAVVPVDELANLVVGLAP